MHWTLEALVLVLLFGIVGQAAHTEKARYLTVTVFVDEVATEELKLRNITVEEILGVANKKFAQQSLGIQYDLATVKVKLWPRFSVAAWKENMREWQKHGMKPHPFWFDPAPRDSKEMHVVIESQDVVKAELRERKTDVLVFLTGNLWLGQGFASDDYLTPHGFARIHNADGTIKRKYRWMTDTAFKIFMAHENSRESGRRKFENGRGVIVLGTGAIVPHEDFPESGAKSREILLKIFSNIVQHEEGHLFGLDHVYYGPDGVYLPHALMNNIVNQDTDDTFDADSLSLLKKKLYGNKKARK